MCLHLNEDKFVMADTLDVIVIVRGEVGGGQMGA